MFPRFTLPSFRYQFDGNGNLIPGSGGGGTGGQIVLGGNGGTVIQPGRLGGVPTSPESGQSVGNPAYRPGSLDIGVRYTANGLPTYLQVHTINVAVGAGATLTEELGEVVAIYNEMTLPAVGDFTCIIPKRNSCSLRSLCSTVKGQEYHFLPLLPSGKYKFTNNTAGSITLILTILHWQIIEE